MKKTGRNDPCPCGSGKKFKKCCESKMIGGRFMATRVDSEASQQIKKTIGMSALFQTRLAQTPKKPEAPVAEPVASETSPVLEEKLPEKENIC